LPLRKDCRGWAGVTPAPTWLVVITAKEKGTAGAVPIFPANPYQFPSNLYEPFTTSRLFWTLNTPKTWFALMPAMCLSMALSTVP